MNINGIDGRTLCRILIVSRHPAAVEFIRRESGLPAEVEAVPSVTAKDLYTECGATVVYGNLPLHLAALCRLVVAVEFGGEPPRGQEYGSEAMKAAGARLQAYRVTKAAAGTPYGIALQIRDSDGEEYDEPLCFFTDQGFYQAGDGYAGLRDYHETEGKQ